MLSSYIPVLVLLALAAGLGSVLLIVAKALGPSRPSERKSRPYESGMDQTSTPKIRFNPQFYRVALLFLVFDIEAAFFYPWAVLFRDLSCAAPLQNGTCTAGITFFGLMVMLLFLAILLLALVFVWRKGALEWD